MIGGALNTSIREDKGWLEETKPRCQKLSIESTGVVPARDGEKGLEQWQWR